MTTPQEPMDDETFERELRRHDLRRGQAGDPHPDDEGSWGWSPGRVAASFLVLSMIAFWMWAFSPWTPRGHPDELDDDAFPTVAEVRCAEALEAVEAVEPAKEATGLDDRADQIETATDILVIMLDDLDAAAPPPGSRDGDLIARWLGDWRIYIGDRYRYATDFRAGIDQAFIVTAVDGDQVTAPIDRFAEVNNMISCVSPPDV